MAFTAYQSFWCIGQVTVLALLASVPTWIWLRRQPKAAARVASVALAAILAVTLLAFISLPGWVRWNSDHYRSPVSASVMSPSGAATDVSAPGLSSTTTGIGLFNLCDFVSHSLRATANDPTRRRGIAWFAVLIATTVAVGFIRFIVAFVYVRRLYQRSDELVSDDVSSIVQSLSAAVGITHWTELRECAELLSPAVIGWRRPAILLPTGWKAWNEEQLQAALAHELAHVRRGDWFTRVGSAFATALHFYHPLVHWLARQLAFSQELAADRLAVEAIGEKSYLRGISQLAIWLDEQPRLRATPLVLPTLSSNLIRRITMLRTKDCSVAANPRRRTAIVVAALAAVALVTTALRGGAAESNASDAKIDVNASPPSSAKLFGRPPLDFSIIGDNPLGAFVIRVGEIVKHPELRRLLESQVLPDEKVFKQSWAQEFGAEVPPPELELDSVDYIAGIANLIIRPVKPVDPSGNTNAVMTGFEQAVVHFNRPVRWKEWFHDHVPGTVEKTDGGVTYLELPVIKALGPKPMFVVARDPQTIVLALGAEVVASASDPAPRPAKSALAARWNELDGGLITFIGTDRDVHVAKSSDDEPGKALAAKVFESTRMFGWAIDFDQASQRAAYRVQLTCDNSATAGETKAAIESLMQLAKATTSAVSEQTKQSTSSAAPAGENSALDEAEQLRMNRLAAELTSNVKISLWQRADDAAGVLVETAASLPDFGAAEATVAREKGATTAK